VSVSCTMCQNFCPVRHSRHATFRVIVKVCEISSGVCIWQFIRPCWTLLWPWLWLDVLTTQPARSQHRYHAWQLVVDVAFWLRSSKDDYDLLLIICPHCHIRCHMSGLKRQYADMSELSSSAHDGTGCLTVVVGILDVSAVMTVDSTFLFGPNLFEICHWVGWNIAIVAGLLCWMRRTASRLWHTGAPPPRNAPRRTAIYCNWTRRLHRRFVGLTFNAFCKTCSKSMYEYYWREFQFA